MRQASTSRGRNIALALAVALLAALGLYRWTGTAEPPPMFSLPATPSPVAAVAARELMGAAVRPSSHPSPPEAPHSARSASLPTQPSSAARPAPPVFDLAKIAPSDEADESNQEKRFRTSDRFTEDDLQHPDLYFTFAERMPELNRPEERRDTLDFFLAYREKLRRDLEAVGENRDKRQQILAVIERYDSAITRLRALIE